MAHPRVRGRRVGDAMVTRPKTEDPAAGVRKIRALFEDDRVHVALIVAGDGRLVTTVERSDLLAARPRTRDAAELGTLAGRTVRPWDDLDVATAVLLRDGRRRLAVVDDDGRLVGLLCLKRDRSGFCSDENVAARAAERVRQAQAAGAPRRPRGGAATR